MRGKADMRICPSSAAGITPAYAGKSKCSDNRRTGQQGSPPPMRGKGFDAYRVGVCPGITPAYAGKSDRHCNRSCVCEDHPRLCGEKCDRNCMGAFDSRITPAYAGKSFVVSTFQTRTLGSPPPMRGKAGCSHNKYKMYGITPAYAGKRHGADVQGVRRWDHPRLCGEKTAKPF